MRPGLPALFDCLDRSEVRYVLIGGLAAVLHGVPRATLDVDLLIEASRINATRLLSALRDTGLGTAHLIDEDELLANEITLFEDLIRVDVFLRIPGVSFDEAWAAHQAKKIDSTTVHVASIETLIASKRAKGRPKDLDDVAALESLLRA